MSNPTFDARDLWRTQVPYYEPDKVEPLTVRVTMCQESVGAI